MSITSNNERCSCVNGKLTANQEEAGQCLHSACASRKYKILSKFGLLEPNGHHCLNKAERSISKGLFGCFSHASVDPLLVTISGLW